MPHSKTMKFFVEYFPDLAKGTGSALFSTLAVITSLQQEMEWWFRMASLAGAIAVSVLTAISLIHKMRKP